MGLTAVFFDRCRFKLWGVISPTFKHTLLIYYVSFLVRVPRVLIGEFGRRKESSTTDFETTSKINEVVLSCEHQILLKVGGSIRQGVWVNWKAVNSLIDHYIHSFLRLFWYQYYRGRELCKYMYGKASTHFLRMFSIVVLQYPNLMEHEKVSHRKYFTCYFW